MFLLLGFKLAMKHLFEENLANIRNILFRQIVQVRAATHARCIANRMRAKNITYFLQHLHVTQTTTQPSISKHGVWSLLLLATIVWSFARVTAHRVTYLKRAFRKDFKQPGRVGIFIVACPLHRRKWRSCRCECESAILLLSQFFWPLFGRTRSHGRCWAAIRLYHRPEPSGHAVHEEVDGFDNGGQHGRRLVLLRHTHSQAAEETIPHLNKTGAETSDTGAEAVKPDPDSWDSHSGVWGAYLQNVTLFAE